VHRTIRPDGDICWQEWTDRGLFDESGQMVGVQSVGRDITERKQAEEALHRQMAFDAVITEVLARFATSGAAELDKAIAEGLEASSRFFGADQAFVLIMAADGKTWSATHEWCAPGVPSTFERYQNVAFGAFPWGEARILGGEIIRIDELSDFPPEAAPDRRNNEAEGVVSVLSVPIRGVSGRVMGCVGLRSHGTTVKWSQKGTARLQIVGNAIASLLERKRAEESLREVSHRLHRAHEEERRRIARELHDSTAQELAAVKMNLEILEDFKAGMPSPAAKLLKESVGLVDRCSQEVRTFSYLLHPPLLDQMGLEAALRSYLDGLAKRSGMDLRIDIMQGLPRQAAEVELTLFRVVQEALGNIRRHSNSNKASILLSAENDRVVLEVTDSGKGMPKRVLEQFERDIACDGVGLSAMKERLRGIGGKLTIENVNPGVRVRAEAPLAVVT
jgi:signal transduction histidine kinase